MNSVQEFSSGDVKLKLYNPDLVNNIGGDTSPNGKSYIALSLANDEYCLFDVNILGQGVRPKHDKSTEDDSWINYLLDKALTITYDKSDSEYPVNQFTTIVNNYNRTYTVWWPIIDIVLSGIKRAEIRPMTLYDQLQLSTGKYYPWLSKYVPNKDDLLNIVEKVTSCQIESNDSVKSINSKTPIIIRKSQGSAWNTVGNTIYGSKYKKTLERTDWLVEAHATTGIVYNIFGNNK